MDKLAMLRRLLTILDGITATVLSLVLVGLGIGCSPDRPAASRDLQETHGLPDSQEVAKKAKGGLDIEGFTLLGRNDQGYVEYRHEATDIVFVYVPGGIIRVGMSPEECARIVEEFGGENENPRALREFLDSTMPVHKVSLDPFVIAKYEVTQEQWWKVMGNLPEDTILKNDLLPVTHVTWTECRDFCARVGLALPSEAQWEYACRAGTSSLFSWGSVLTPSHANFSTEEEEQDTLAMVDSLPANQFGLHQMHGNVEEWCLDVFDPSAYTRREAAGPNPVCVSVETIAFRRKRVVRGGSFWDKAVYCLSAMRHGEYEEHRSFTLGFRPIFCLSSSVTEFGAQPVPPPPTPEQLSASPGLFGFAHLGTNTEGYHEYRHEATDIVFVELPGGTFDMGRSEANVRRCVEELSKIWGVGFDEAFRRDRWLSREQPRHKVSLSPFLMAKYEMSQKVWEAQMSENPSRFSGRELPVESISWEDSWEFCRKTGLRLPTEAQWEFAACPEEPSRTRADRMFVGERPLHLGPVEAHDSVDEGTPNKFGLFHMNDNVEEWCLDTASENFYSKPEAAGPDPLCLAGFSRVRRRGGYNRDIETMWGGLGPLSVVRKTPWTGFRPAFPLSTPDSEPSVVRVEMAPGPVDDGGHRPDLHVFRAAPRDFGFSFIGENAQGYPEYRHDATSIRFVQLPGGTFEMGRSLENVRRSVENIARAKGEKFRRTASNIVSKEGPRHRVTLSPFLVAKYELSQRAWREVMGGNPSAVRNERYPVEMVSWRDCQEFCRRTGLQLPTEAQWEFACMVRATTVYPKDDTFTPEIEKYERSKESRTAVDSGIPNSFGLHHMSSNVEEWCRDTYHGDLYSRPEATSRDPLCVANSEFGHVRRSGGFSRGNVIIDPDGHRFLAAAPHVGCRLAFSLSGHGGDR